MQYLADNMPDDKHRGYVGNIRDVLASLPYTEYMEKMLAICTNVEQRRTLCHLNAFFEALRQGNLTREEREKHVQKLLCDKDAYDKECEYVMFLLDNHEAEVKSFFLGKIALAYYREQISEDEFYEISEVNRRMLIRDYSFLNALNKSPLRYCERFNPFVMHIVDRVIGLGLVKKVDIAGFAPSAETEIYYVNDFGKKFLKIIDIDWDVTIR